MNEKPTLQNMTKLGNAKSESKKNLMKLAKEVCLNRVEQICLPAEAEVIE